MSASFEVRVFDEEKRPVFIHEYSKRVEIGRQDRGEQGPYYTHLTKDVRTKEPYWRLIIAHQSEDTVSRTHLSVEPLEDGRLRIRNGSKSITVRLAPGDELMPNESRDLVVPVQMMLGRKMIRVMAPDSVANLLNGELPEATLPPGDYDGLATRMGGIQMPDLKGNDPTAMIRWFQAVMEVLNAAASSSDFFDKAAHAAAEMVGLDSVSVWLYKNDDWTLATQQTSRNLISVTKAPASRHVLNKVRQRRKTLWDKPEGSHTATTSLDSVAAVVAAPILNPKGDVIGVLYGDRSFLSVTNRQRGEITEVQAMLVELLAGGIAVGLERIKHDEDRIQFEQFFTSDLVKQLEQNKDSLKSRDCEVTILFCDIRGFSRISENHGPAKTVEWINGVMEVLSDSVLAHQGVLVDYIGDELMAMWGAPKDQPDHAVLACRAALDILERLPEMVERWKPILEEEFDLGIGLNTGIARVGNTGTQRKFKYGPLGPPVNLASRVQGATKHFKTRLIVTGQTKAKIDDSFCTRRLGKVRVVNIAEPVELYEMVPCDAIDWATLQNDYEAALIHFEAQRFRHATGLLSNIQIKHPNDGPSLMLLARVVNSLCEIEPFDPVWILPSK